MSINYRMVEALRVRISDGAFWPSGDTTYADRAAYRAEARRLEQTEFKAEALVATGLEGHPKADKAWRLAWDKGHAYGLQEVLSELETLAELLS